MTAIAALVRKEARVMRRDQRFLLWLFLFPIAMILLLKGAIGDVSRTGRGADLAVPGFTVMFSFDIITYIGVSHYREHSWKVWTIVRSLGIRRLELVIGILLPFFVLGTLQMLLMLGFGAVAFRASMTGSPLALVLLVIATQLAAAGLAILLLNLTSSLTTMKQMTQMIVFVLGAIGGALVPVALLDGWARGLARLTPQYWSIEGIKQVMSGGAGIADVWANIALLGAAGALMLVLGAAYFDPQKSRRAPAR